MRIVILLLAVGSVCWGIEKKTPPNSDDDNQDPELQLLTIRRVYVDRLSGGPTAEQIRDMIIASLQSARLFVLTENQDRADAILRGSAEDLVFTDTFVTSDSIHGNTASSNHSSSGESTGGAYDRWSENRSSGRSLSLGVGENESSNIRERKHESVASVRLVGKNGDVIWSSTQESLGGKFRGASADVADKIMKQLMAEYNRLKTKPQPARPEAARKEPR